jgi:DNA repair protein RecN (Recombination protein N)
MLTKLHINNYAIIDEVEVDFSNGLNSITGETGAGKSILMGALALVLGERADTSVLLEKEKKCVVEGYFNVAANKEVQQFLESNELDSERELLIRREINANGKSRAFINDTPVNLDQLRELSSMIIDLHRQFDTLELGKSDFQREVIDALADHASVLDEYRGLFHQWQQKKKELELLQQMQLQANKELDYQQFMFDELEEAAFKENELEELDAELKLLGHSEEIKSTLDYVYGTMKEGEQPMVAQLKSLANKLRHYATLHDKIPALVERMDAAQIELADIADELEMLNEKIGFDAERISYVNDRISLGYKLLKKHAVQTTADLLRIKNELQQKLDVVLNLDSRIEQLGKEVSALYDKASKLADKISANRNKQTPAFVKKVDALLSRVGMPNAHVKVEIHKVSLNENGADQVEFLFDANKSGRFEPIRKVASGGELSRLMLCIKSLVAKFIQLPTLIFDEIDSGISGEAAKQVSMIMKELAVSHQIICITHQPQIAGKASAHFMVYKEPVNEKVKTRIRLLDSDERIIAIARMLSGEKPSAAAIENAREMMN